MQNILNIQGITRVIDFGCVKVSGLDAKRFLQGQLTCHLDEITATQSRLGAHCNPQGRIISFFRLFLYQDEYYLYMPKEIIDRAIMALQKYAVFFKVTLTDVSQQLAYLGIQGSIATSLLTELPDSPDAVYPASEFFSCKLASHPDRYLLIGSNLALTALEKKLSETMPILADNSWKQMDIVAGLPQLYPSTVEKLLPHDINLPLLNAIHFNKGCYTGQEIIARMQYRGKLKKCLLRARVQSDHPFLPGSDLYQENATGPETCGTLIDFCLEQDNNYLVLVTAENNSQLKFLDPQQKIPLEFLYEK